jgi:hypothetical protein
MSLAGTVETTEGILLRAMRMETLALSKFGHEQMLPLYEGQLNPTDRETAVGMTFYRLLACVHTLGDLTQPYHFQSIASSTRTVFELCVDTALLTQNLVENAVERFHGFTRAARFSAAFKLVTFYDEHASLAPFRDDDVQRQLVHGPGNQQQIEDLCQTLWGKHRAPPHWSGLRWQQQMEKVQIEMAEQFERFYPLVSWFTHGGGAGVGGLTARSFMGLEMVCRELLRRVVPTAFRQVAEELRVPKLVPGFYDHLDFIVTKFETLCVIDAKLQALGRPSKFGGTEDEPST